MPLSQILKALSTRPSRRRNRRTSGFPPPPVTEREKLQPQPEEGVTPGHRPRHSGNCFRQPATLTRGTTWHHPRRDGSTSCQGRPPHPRALAARRAAPAAGQSRGGRAARRGSSVRGAPPPAPPGAARARDSGSGTSPGT